MEVIRKNHNDAKRNLIQSVSKEGEHILDVGCGFRWRPSKMAQVWGKH